MAATAREEAARILGGRAPVGAASASLEVPVRGLVLEVDGVGPVSLPVRAPRARKLIEVACPARFGRGEETLSDTDVRDTWEISPDRFSLGGANWPTVLADALDHFRDALGLPATTRLRAEPHAMLVYGTGQFFLPHQDSEKDDSMVGTLVVSLPSAHSGGALVVEHAGRNETYRGSRQKLTLVAFYSDCRHEVTPVTSGYRVTITFNLLAEKTRAGVKKRESGPLGELVDCLEQHFSKPGRPRYGGRDLDPPNRLVYLLDHEYTQRGLSWDHLKGTDADRAALLRAAAEQTGCESVLALAEVKETWEAWPSGSDPWDDNYYGEDDPEEEAGNDDYELQDLIDDEFTLGWWTTPDSGSGEEISLHVGSHEVCASTPSGELTPYESQYEGYMGNYGNTLDRWYRRAAVVVWPRDRGFAARAEAGPAWALRDLRDRIDRGDLDGARGAARSLAPFWNQVTGGQPELLDGALRVADGLDSADIATALLEPFRVDTLTATHTGPLASVAQHYGEHWTRRLVDHWFGDNRRFTPDPYGWTKNLPALCTALRAEGSPATASALTVRTWGEIHSALRASTGIENPSARRPRMERLAPPLALVLESADDRLCDEVPAALRAFPDTVLECLMPMLRGVAKGRPGPFSGTPGLDAVALDCADRLRVIAAQPLREVDDWSVAWTTPCGCELCAALDEFLTSRSRRSFEWPLAQAKRQHVHSQIDGAGLPVSHQTRRQGRPFTLVLQKTQALFTRESTARSQAETDLAWLASR